MKSAGKTPEEALRASVDAIGGLQECGHLFRPDADPAIAGQWLSHCLTATKRDKLALSQIVLLFRRAGLLGEHDGFATFAACCGYAATPITPEAEFTAALKRAEAVKADATRAAADLESLMDNPELLARMRAAGLNVGELA